MRSVFLCSVIWSLLSGPVAFAEQAAFDVESYQLLVREADFGKRVVAKDLALYLKKIGLASTIYWTKYVKPWRAQLAIFVAIKANGKHKLWTESLPTNARATKALKLFTDTISHAKPPRVTDTIVLAIHARIGGAKKGQYPRPKPPASWRPKKGRKHQRLYKIVERLF